MTMHRQLDSLIRDHDPEHAPSLLSISPASGAEFVPPSFAVHVNVCWFTSLTLSLTAGVIGILCLQWLRAYQSIDPSIPAQTVVEIRALRLRGLEQWKVPQIIATLPVLLQSALILFLGGMIILLWNINPTVASVIAVLVGLTILFLLLTTILPSVTSFPDRSRGAGGSWAQCPYKSPMSWAFRAVYLRVWLLAKELIRAMGKTYSEWKLVRSQMLGAGTLGGKSLRCLACPGMMIVQWRKCIVIRSLRPQPGQVAT